MTTEHGIRLGVTTAGTIDPWDLVLFQGLRSFGILPTLLGKPVEDNSVDAIAVETFGGVNVLRRIRILNRGAHKLHDFAIRHHVRQLPSLLGLDDAIIGLRYLVRDYDVVMALETFRASTYQAVCAGRPTIVKVTENIARNPPQLPFAYFREKVRQRANRLVCVSEMARQALIAEGFDTQRIAVIPEAVDTDRFAPPSSHQVIDDVFVVGFAGRLDQSHGIIDLLLAMDALTEQINVKLKVAGDGPLASRAVALSSRGNLKGRVEFTGKVAYREMPSFLQSIDVLCVPCRPVPGWVPQFGFVNVEAMACGRPVVATRCGVTPEIVPPGLDSFLVEPGDTYGLADRLRALGADETRRQRLGLECRTWAISNFNYRMIAARWVDLLRELVNSTLRRTE